MSGPPMAVYLRGGERVALVDESDWPEVRARAWAVKTTKTTRTQYARTTTRAGVSLHNMIMRPPPGRRVDHVNGDGLDCRRENMRLSTVSQNAQNAMKSRFSRSSRFKGVCLHKRIGKWKATITLAFRNRHLGYFEIEADAARAYDDAALKHFGEFARTNKSLGLLE